MNILPAKQDEIFLKDRVDSRRREFLANGPAMLVINDALGLIQYFPAALPGLVTEIGVFEIKRAKQLVESAEREELSAVESAGTSAAIEAGKSFRDRRVYAMPHAQAAILPPALRQPGLFPKLGGVAEKNLTGNGKDFFVREAREKRREKIRLHAHVAVEQHDDVVSRRAEACIRAA